MAKITTATTKGAGKTPAAARPARRSKPGVLASLRRYLLESWAELKRVNWPTPREVSRFTGVVLITIIAVAVLIWMLDVVFLYISTKAFNL